MDIRKYFYNFVSKGNEAQHFKMVIDSDGLNFILPSDDFNKLKNGEGIGWSLQQYVYFRMLLEQGYAEQIKNGFFITRSMQLQLKMSLNNFLAFHFPIRELSGSGSKDRRLIELFQFK